MDMRSLIDLMEATTVVPISASDRDRIITAMVRHALHGEYWDTHALEHYPEKFEGGVWEHGESMADEWGVDPDGDEFPAKVQEWAEARCDNVLTKLAAIPTQQGRYLLHRQMHVPQVQIDHWKSGLGTRLGLYWTFDIENWGVGAYSIWSRETPGGSDVLIEAMVEPSSVDWPMTVMANMDWHSGDEEHEMRLLARADVDVVEIKVLNEKGGAVESFAPQGSFTA